MLIVKFFQATLVINYIVFMNMAVFAVVVFCHAISDLHSGMVSAKAEIVSKKTNI